jgi:hypothetical protein
MKQTRSGRDELVAKPQAGKVTRLGVWAFLRVVGWWLRLKVHSFLNQGELFLHGRSQQLIKEPLIH